MSVCVCGKILGYGVHVCVCVWGGVWVWVGELREGLREGGKM